MTTTTKALLGISFTSFLLSVTGLLWGLFAPLGAIFFGLFLISKMLEKEVARFNEEERLRIQKAEQIKASEKRAAAPAAELRGKTLREALSH